MSVGRHATVVFVLALASLDADAQRSEADSAQCYGFSFGTWRPPLDLAAAGHSAALSTPTQPKAPGGRDWASDATPNDTTLFLFPAWWPAGIQVTFARKPRAGADTVTGHATALVADGGLAPPRAPTRVWRVTCR